MSDVFFQRGQKGTGVVVLNRPKALNALSLEMIEALLAQLQQWADDPEITRVVVTSTSDRAFCAGGDIRALYTFGQAEDPDFFMFYRKEYQLDHLIHTYPKPYISLLNGLVMGGGVGISLHGSHRIGTSNLVWAMPETGIGFFPDVGASWFLPRLPAPGFGRALGLCGTRLGLGDASALGLVTHCVSPQDLPSLFEALMNGEPLEAVLDHFSISPPPSFLWEHREEIAHLFQADSLGALAWSLKTSSTEIGQRFWAEWSTKSPFSLALTFQQLTLGADFIESSQAFALEYRMACRMRTHPDFFAGVRAVVIEKTMSPVWVDTDLSQIPDSACAPFFAPLDHEEWTPVQGSSGRSL